MADRLDLDPAADSVFEGELFDELDNRQVLQCEPGGVEHPMTPLPGGEAVGIPNDLVQLRPDLPRHELLALVGVTVSGRPPDLEGAEAIVGSFVNNMPARLRIDRAQLVSEWVRGAQRDQAHGHAHEHVSLRDIREWAEVPQPHPLFDTLVLLNLAEAPETADWPDLELRLVTATLDAGYPLILAAGLEGDGLVRSLVHDATFHDADTALSAVANALAAIAAAPSEANVETLVAGVKPLPAAPVGVMRAPASSNGVSRTEAADGATAGALLQTWRDVLGVERDRPADTERGGFSPGGAMWKTARR